MKLGIFTDGLLHLAFEPALDKIASLGIQAVEIGTGNFSPAPHCDMAVLLRGGQTTSPLQKAVTRRGPGINGAEFKRDPPPPPPLPGSQHDRGVRHTTPAGHSP